LSIERKQSIQAATQHTQHKQRVQMHCAKAQEFIPEVSENS